MCFPFVNLTPAMGSAEADPGGTLAGGEFDQTNIVLPIGSAQSLEVLRTSRIFIAQQPTSPGEPIVFEMTGQDEISVEPREPTVTVGEGMDEDEPMVHADRIF